MNNENEFRQILISSLEKCKDVLLLDHPDELKRVLGFHPELARYLVEKPYDLGALRKGHYYGLELKNENKNLTWNISTLEKHQIVNLKKCTACGGTGIVLVRFKKAIDPKAQKRLGRVGEWAIDTTFILPIKELLATKLTSFSYEYLQENFSVLELCPYGKKYELENLWKTTKIVKKR